VPPSSSDRRHAVQDPGSLLLPKPRFSTAASFDRLNKRPSYGASGRAIVVSAPLNRSIWVRRLTSSTPTRIFVSTVDAESEDTTQRLYVTPIAPLDQHCFTVVRPARFPGFRLS
jgi:hypothetical protein